VKFMEYKYPVLPGSFQPHLFKYFTVREMLLIFSQFGPLQIAERIGYTELANFLKAQDQNNLGVQVMRIDAENLEKK
jgi:hypothetical protein